MKDVQNEPDVRGLPLRKVGVSGIVYPIRVMDRQEGFQNTVSRINMYVDLPEKFRGTHMSRFVAVLNKHKCNMNLNNLEDILEDMKAALRAKEAHIEVYFPYFIWKKAPVSGIGSFMNYECAFLASKGNRFDFVLEVNTPVHSLCPCSKEISNYGTHNQRANIKVQVRMKKLVWIEEIVEISENAASAPLFALLKREDEKYIVEHAYKNPKFVEDMVRDVLLVLEQDSRITYYSVEATSFESIHNHDAYAYYSKDKRA